MRPFKQLGWGVWLMVMMLTTAVVTLAATQPPTFPAPSVYDLGPSLLEILPGNGGAGCYTFPLCTNVGCGEVVPPVCYYMLTAVASLTPAPTSTGTPTPRPHTSYTVPLPSGGAELAMYASAGQVWNTILLALLLLVNTFALPRSLRRRLT